MNDSADIKTAAQSLQSALKKLEGAIDPFLNNYAKLQSDSSESESFTQDRARLASELDDVKSEKEELEKKMASREKEFAAVAAESTQEINSVIKTVQTALEGLPS
tara:strand:- start:452 stop:766 length:315 start_codon:yes stop_codon:yes gene_type:complete